MFYPLWRFPIHILIPDPDLVRNDTSLGKRDFQGTYDMLEKGGSKILPVVPQLIVWSSRADDSNSISSLTLGGPSRIPQYLSVLFMLN